MRAVEKLLARASGRSSVAPGDVVVANVDRLIMHDLSGYLTAQVFEREVGGSIRYPDRVYIVFDHNFAPATLTQAEALRYDREWADRHGVTILDCGSGNIHNAISEHAGITPGMVVVGSDSHTGVHGVMGAFAAPLGNNSHAGTVLRYGKAWFRVPETINIKLEGRLPSGSSARDVALWLSGEIGEGGARYKAIEYTGGFVDELPFWDRWLLPLITIDLGAKNSFIAPDEVTHQRLKELGLDWTPDGLAEPTPTSEYDTVWEWNVDEIGPQVACPPTVGNVHPVEKVVGTELQWAELGGHGGARIDDIRVAARLLEGRKKHPRVRLNIVPSTREVFDVALAQGWVRTLHEAGANWFPASTGSNQAINMGALAKGEAMISTHARNFTGRNGSPEASMYLSSALTVTASALAGEIADPRVVFNDAELAAIKEDAS